MLALVCLGSIQEGISWVFIILFYHRNIIRVWARLICLLSKLIHPTYPMAMQNHTIPPELDIHRAVFRTMGDLASPGLLGCGFMQKTPADSSLGVRFPHFGVVYLLRGRGSYRSGISGSEKLEPGSLFFRVPGELHSTEVYGSEEPGHSWLECFVAFGTPMYQGLRALDLLPGDSRVQYPGLDLPLARRWLAAADHLEKAPPADLGFCLLECQNLVFTLLRRGITGQSSGPAGPERRYARETLDHHLRLAEQAAEALADPVTAVLGLEEIASELGVSYSLLRRIFPRYMGMSMSQYRIRQRVDRARGLLMDSTWSLKEIARHLGYPDAMTFSRQFRLVAGLTPAQFRRTR